MDQRRDGQHSEVNAHQETAAGLTCYCEVLDGLEHVSALMVGDKREGERLKRSRSDAERGESVGRLRQSSDQIDQRVCGLDRCKGQKSVRSRGRDDGVGGMGSRR